MNGEWVTFRVNCPRGICWTWTSKDNQKGRNCCCIVRLAKREEVKGLWWYSRWNVSRGMNIMTLKVLVMVKNLRKWQISYDTYDQRRYDGMLRCQYGLKCCVIASKCSYFSDLDSSCASMLVCVAQLVPSGDWCPKAGNNDIWEKPGPLRHFCVETQID